MIVAAASFGLLNFLPVNFLPLGRADPAAQRSGDGSVRLTEPGRHHEQPAAQPARRRRRDDGDLPELRDRLSIGVFFSLIILGLSQHLPSQLYNGLTRPGRTGRHGAPTIRAAAGEHAVRRPARLQPDPGPCSARTSSPTCPPARRSSSPGAASSRT